VAKYQLELSLQASVVDSPERDVSQFTTPPRPDCDLLEIIHRKHDGYITFHRKHDGVWEDLASIPANCLPGLFEQLVPIAEYDSYASLNGMYRTGWSDNEHNLIGTDSKPLKKPSEVD